MGTKLALLRVATVSLLMALSACGYGPASSTSGNPIPWVATKAGPPPTAQSPTPSTVNLPACSAQELGARLGPASAGAGTTYRQIVVSNLGTNECQLAGTPAIEVFDMMGSRVPAPVSSIVQPPITGSVALVPGVAAGPEASPATQGQALLVLAWPSNMCLTRDIASASIGLPNTQGNLTVGLRIPTSSDGGCVSPQLSVSAFSSPTVVSPPNQTPDLTVAYNVPSSVVAGQTLTYSITLTNVSGRTISFGTCPGYTEALKQAQVAARYVLNCGPVGSLQTGVGVTFAMEFPIPAASAGSERSGDPDVLTWVLDPPLLSVNATGPARVLVTAG